MDQLGALAIFVKTPRLSPVKTRLAADIGRPYADEFFKLAVRATAALADALRASEMGLTVYWAVAEEAAVGATEWSNFDNISQGVGELGSRLAKVYEACVRQHGFVGLIGADSPHLSLARLQQAVRLTAQHRTEKYVLGETTDGGFYYFGGGRPIATSIWTATIYSRETTAQDLKTRLEAEVLSLEKDFDVDVGTDLEKYQTLQFGNDLLPAQRELVEWARSIKI